MNTQLQRVGEPLTQFDLTKKTLNNLSQLDITPTAKLVLLYLTSCYNPKHADVFPKQKTIALKLGISERSVIRAVQELFKAGLILIECKHTNRYILMPNSTSQLSQNDKLSKTECQNDTFTPDNLSPHEHEQKKETKKEQLIKGGNVYWTSEQSARAERSHVYCECSLEGDSILRIYAKKHGARNIDSYVKTLKSSPSADKIINEYKRKRISIEQRSIETQKRIELYKEYERTAVNPKTCTAWVELGEKLGIKK